MENPEKNPQSKAKSSPEHVGGRQVVSLITAHVPTVLP